MLILVDTYGAAGSFVFDTCCIDIGCTEHSLFIHFPWLGRDTKKQKVDCFRRSQS